MPNDSSRDSDPESLWLSTETNTTDWKLKFPEAAGLPLMTC